MGGAEKKFYPLWTIYFAIFCVLSSNTDSNMLNRRLATTGHDGLSIATCLICSDIPSVINIKKHFSGLGQIIG